MSENAGEHPERLRTAALHYKKEIFEAQTHGLAIEKIEKQYGKKLTNEELETIVKEGGYGFTTTHGRFVSREEAMNIGREQKQVIGDHRRELESEYLIDPDV